MLGRADPMPTILSEAIAAHLLSVGRRDLRETLAHDLNVAHLAGYSDGRAQLLSDLHQELDRRLANAPEEIHSSITAAMAVVLESASRGTMATDSHSGPDREGESRD